MKIWWSIGVGKPSGICTNVARDVAFIVRALVHDGWRGVFIGSGRDWGRAG
jgi:hypothetical protein